MRWPFPLEKCGSALGKRELGIDCLNNLFLFAVLWLTGVRGVVRKWISGACLSQLVASICIAQRADIFGTLTRSDRF